METVVDDRVDAEPCVIDVGEAETVGATSAVLVVTDTAVDCVEVTFPLSVTVTVIDTVPVALGV